MSRRWCVLVSTYIFRLSVPSCDPKSSRLGSLFINHINANLLLHGIQVEAVDSTEETQDVMELKNLGMDSDVEHHGHGNR